MDIEILISQYIDGELSSESEAELHHMLSVSPEARALFRQQIALQNIARDVHVLHTPAPALRNALFQRLQVSEGMSPAAAQFRPAAAPAGAAPGRTAVPPDTVKTHMRTSGRRRRMFTTMLPFLLGVALVGSMWLLYDQITGTAGKGAKEIKGSIVSNDAPVTAQGQPTDVSSDAARSPQAAPGGGIPSTLSATGGTDADAAGTSAHRRAFTAPGGGLNRGFLNGRISDERDRSVMDDKSESLGNEAPKDSPASTIPNVIPPAPTQPASNMAEDALRQQRNAEARARTLKLNYNNVNSPKGDANMDTRDGYGNAGSSQADTGGGDGAARHELPLVKKGPNNNAPQTQINAGDNGGMNRGEASAASAPKAKPQQTPAAPTADAEQTTDTKLKEELKPAASSTPASGAGRGNTLAKDTTIVTVKNAAKKQSGPIARKKKAVQQNSTEKVVK